VPLNVLQLFLDSLKGISVTITNENVSYLSELCSEFSFNRLKDEITRFRDFCGFEPEQRRPVVQPQSGIETTNPISIALSGLQNAILTDAFTFVINGKELEIDVVEAIALSPAVETQLLVDSCARRFVLNDPRVDLVDFSSLRNILFGRDFDVAKSSLPASK
jgi:hypothetical protein